jgi:endonuclease III
MAEFALNKKRGVDVSRKAVSMLEDKVFPFVLPDAIMPDGIEEGSLDHSRFLFYSCSIDAMRSAQEVYAAMRGLVKDLRLDLLYAYPEAHLEAIISKHLEKPGGINRPAKILSHNAMKMHEEYGNDPRNLNDGTIDGTIKSIRKFYGIGIGKAALIMKNFVRFGIWDFSEYDIPIKVDRHIVRISIGTGVVELPDGVDVIRSDKIAKPLSGLYQEITSEKKISAIKVNDALWSVGSQLCFANSHLNCNVMCQLGCYSRPGADSRAIWFYPSKEHRRHGLFKNYRKA